MRTVPNAKNGTTPVTTKNSTGTPTKLARLSAQQRQSRVPIAAEDLPLVVSMLNDVFRNRRGLLQTRSYGLGERNPATLYTHDGFGESAHEHFVGTRHWQKMRRVGHPVAGCGIKYV